ncbi:L,D-transpeptidase family protein [Roseomonas sp. SSH11]|uniref:L,D-transpeptidase family protein n=1 Tax=Pararoseomonas baculiformis TaxID=2820812 RepID=A0ABS4AE97_9PROT|nr:L,D-transpeptidase family protein [Pararoseomonas baculiformis]MBP0445319.1 L,D-transpeptidase family protein [Pararoseomonas baculiformis]
MLQTRRSLVRALALGGAAAPLGSLLRPGVALAQPVSGGMAVDMRDYLRRARNAMPSANRSGRVAVERTLERLDDLNVDLSVGRLILVNIAAAQLIAYEGGREVMRSRVIVGARKTATPQLASFVTGARYNPPWYVPASIEPEVRASGISGFRVVNGRLIQPPGPNNPLGQVRIGLYDSDGIFLHGTNSPGLFARENRALSHGCVRVEKVREVTAWMLNQTPAAVQARLATGRTLEITPPQDVEVVLAYLTAWPDANGRVQLHQDPYGLDAAGARRAPYRRVTRPVPPNPEEVQPTIEASGMAPAEDNPL